MKQVTAKENKAAAFLSSGPMEELVLSLSRKKKKKRKLKPVEFYILNSPTDKSCQGLMENCKILNIYQKYLCSLKHFLFFAANLKSANKVCRRLPSIITVNKTHVYVFNTYLLN